MEGELVTCFSYAYSSQQAEADARADLLKYHGHEIDTDEISVSSEKTGRLIGEPAKTEWVAAASATTTI